MNSMSADPTTLFTPVRVGAIEAANRIFMAPLTLTPHTSARTLRDDSIAQIASKIRALAAGQPVSSLAGVVDHGLGY